MKFSPILTCSLGLGACHALPHLEVDVEKRAACNSDNVLRALQHRTPDSYSFCSSYISQPSATTTTVYTDTWTFTETTYSYSTRHPANLYNLQRWESTQTPIKYSSPSPSPSKVPGSACYYPSGGYCATPGPFKREIEARAATTPPTTTASGVPSYLATVPPSRTSSGCSCLSPPYATTITSYDSDYTQVTKTCTSYPPSAVTTYPAFCAPTVQVNAPVLQTTRLANITAVKPFNARDKVTCCAACASVFNCVWWKFSFAKPFADGSGNPWAPGSCQFGFSTVVDPTFTDYGNTAAICPNGKYSVIDQKYDWSGKESANSKPGYNHGACGGPVGEFQSSQDFGWPDYTTYQEQVCPAD